MPFEIVCNDRVNDTSGCGVRMGCAIEKGWKSRIDEDYQKRGKNG